MKVDAVSTDVYAKSARLSIAVWTYHVTIVVGFEDEELKAANRWFKGEEPRVHRPVNFRKLSPASLLQ